jgi:glycosyltransferase involved in cell wall biosynthesis
LRIVFLVERPTQFEAPFFRFAANDPLHEMRVIFTGAAPEASVFDPEVGQSISWGIDLVGGYSHTVAPRRGRVPWLARQLRRGSCDLLITNGYTRADYLIGAALARRAGIATALRLDSVRWPDPATARALSDRSPSAPPSRPLGPTSHSSTSAPVVKHLLYSLLLLRLYDLFLGVGSLTLDYLQACGVPPRRCGLFPYAIDVEQFRARSRLTPAARATARERLGLAPGDAAVLAVAKLNEREAPWDLLAALPHLPPEVRLLLAGDGPLRAEVERRATALAPGRTRFLGYVPYPDLPALYAAADLFVHAPREERWGVSVAEALACGLPAISSSRVGAGYDLLRPGVNGWLYPAGDTQTLAQRITQALALLPATVAAASASVLAAWDYTASWNHILKAAAPLIAAPSRLS